MICENTDTITIFDKGVIHIIDKEPHENIGDVYKRGWYIINNKEPDYYKAYSLSIININKNMPRKSSISYRMMAEEKEDISPLQEDVSYDILNSDSLVNVSIDSDRTYYYSNQDYKGISKAIDKNVPIDYDVNNIALFVGEGHIFNLLPTLSKYVSQVIVIDRDDKLINYKRNELKAPPPVTNI